MPLRTLIDPRKAGLAAVGALCFGVGYAATPDVSFMAEQDIAMARMMADMTVRASGDVDVDFVAMMVPHHQAAIDMATSVLRYGRNEQIRRIAQEIVVEQQQEIAAMRLAVGQPLPPSVAAPTHPGMDGAHACRMKPSERGPGAAMDQ